MANQTVINFTILILLFVEICLYYDAMFEFYAWLKTGSNPADRIGFKAIIEKRIHTLHFVIWFK